jgi:hypothetical protein
MYISEVTPYLKCKAKKCSYNSNGRCSNLPLVMINKDGKCQGFGFLGMFKKEVKKDDPENTRGKNL